MGRRKSYVVRYHELCEKARNEFKNELISMGLTRYDFKKGDVVVKSDEYREYLAFVVIENDVLQFETFEDMSNWVDRSFWIEAYEVFLRKEGKYYTKFK